jgi:CHAT domain-containing protein
MSRRRIGWCCGACCALLLLGTVFHPDPLRAEEDPTDLTTRADILYRQGDLAAAEPLLRQALDLQTRSLGPDAPELAATLTQLGRLEAAQARYAEAEAAFKEAHRILAKEGGPDRLEIADLLTELGKLAGRQGRYPEAEPLFAEAEAIITRHRGADDPGIALPLTLRATVLDAEGRYGEAEALMTRALAISEQAFGSDQQWKLIGILNTVGVHHMRLGRYAEAELFFKRVAAITEQAYGPDHPDTGSALNNLAQLYKTQGRYAEAEPLLLRMRAIVERSYGPQDPHTATALASLAFLYQDLGRYREAEPLFLQALAIQEKVLGAEHPDLAGNLNNLALLYKNMGRLAEAEPLLQRALAIHEKALGPEHADLAGDLDGLANLYAEQGRRAEALPLFERALAVTERALGPYHPAVADELHSLALFYQEAGVYTATIEGMFLRAIAIREKALGPDDAKLAGSLGALANFYADRGDDDRAEPLLRRAISILEKVFGPDHPSVANQLTMLALLDERHDRLAEAEPMLRRALGIWEATYGDQVPKHPLIAMALGNLSRLDARLGKNDLALAEARQATAIQANRALSAQTARSTGAGAERKSYRRSFLHHLDLAIAAVDADQAARTDEGFRLAQLAHATAADQALSRMAARLGAGDDALADLVRRQQDLTLAWRGIDAKLSVALGEADAVLRANLRAQLAEAGASLDALDLEIAAKFPAYAELAKPSPLAAGDTQVLLAEDEALLVYAIGETTSHLFVLRRDRIAHFVLDLDAASLGDLVAALREKLDPVRNPRLGPFPIEAARTLYAKILAPALPLLEGARLIDIVPDGPLESLPFGVLVTGETPAIKTYADYQQVPWLDRRFATAVLPSVSSLRALRVLARPSQAPLPFAGFGAPLLGKDAKPVAVAALYRGALADVDAVRALPPLPETGPELEAMARSLEATPDSLFLGARATETNLKAAPLDRYRVIAFATHGLTAGDLGLGEPALVMTPPATASATDDGLLGASEVVALKLDADWILLSACNTAAPDGSPGAEGLSGLAKSFFYAGARALLVSHWVVESHAAVAVTTGALAVLQDHPEIGRAEALRRARMDLLDHPLRAQFSHPALWAPFEIVGEGR